MRKLAFAAALACAGALAACSTNQVMKIQQASANFQTAVVAINGDIAAVAPNVAAACADVQKAAMLLAPFVPSSPKAKQDFDTANAAINAYCQQVPTDIGSTATAVSRAATAALAAYKADAAAASK